MNNKFFAYFSKKDLFGLGLIFLMVFSRLIPHPPNFTPIIAVAIMSGYFFKKIHLSFFVLLISMLLSDLFIGFYKNMFIVYLSLFLITYIFFNISRKIEVKNLIIYSFIGSLIFYLITNFGFWLFGSIYEKNLNGLIYCYYLAIPFFTKTLVSTIFFSYLAFFANYFYIKKFI